MRRRTFLKAGGATALLAGLGSTPLRAHIDPHIFDKYDFGSGPPVADRLYQGPFASDEYPRWNVVMAVTPSREIVPNPCRADFVADVSDQSRAVYPGLIIGFANDGIAGVPGVLRVSVVSQDGKVNVGGSLDAGYPLPGKVRQAKFPLPKGTNWKGASQGRN